MKIRSLLLMAVLLLAGTLWAEKQVVRIACVGNSITYGHGIKDREHDSYPAVLGRLLGKGFEVENFGVSGRTCLNKGDHPYMKEKRYQEALAFNPDIVIIKLGTNDTKPHNWKYHAEFKQDLTALVNSFQRLPSKPTIYLCYPATVYTLDWGINDSIIVNGVIPYIKEVAKKCHTRIIDFHTLTANMPENFPDKLHPNEAGAAIMANAVYERLLNDYPSIRKEAVQWMKKGE